MAQASAQDTYHHWFNNGKGEEGSYRCIDTISAGGQHLAASHGRQWMASRYNPATVTHDT